MSSTTTADRGDSDANPATAIALLTAVVGVVLLVPSAQNRAPLGASLLPWCGCPTTASSSAARPSTSACREPHGDD
eukprot:6850149-Alexandrium_andersonii.AAC.1